jgi:HAD superfamily hydrolase (TIGR01509 family)
VRSKIGMGGDKLLMELAGIDIDSVEGKLLSERRVALFKAYYLPDLGPTPGARALVERLRSRGFKTVVVTSATADEIADLTREAAVAGLFDQIVTSDDADASKPDPDLVQAALEKLGVGPREAVMIGDTPYDITSAARAGVSTIALRSGGWKDRDLASAIAIYDHPADLMSHLDASPLVMGVDDEMPSVPASVGRRGRARRPAIPA